VDLDKYYSEINTQHRWQGDVFASEDFSCDMPNDSIKYWMLLNRTCQMVENETKTVKISSLVFCALIPIEDFFTPQMPASKNKIKNIITGKTDNLAFLPTSDSIQSELIIDFNLIYTFSLNNSPKAPQKKLQLSSPYSEHILQRFSRWFYTVGIDDADLRDEEYINSLVEQCTPD